MPSLRDVSRRHSQWFLNRLTDLADRFRQTPEAGTECRDELNRLWAQFQAGQSWSCRNSKVDAAAAILASGYAGLCAEAEISLLQAHQSQSIRATWLSEGIKACHAMRDELGEATHRYNLGLVMLTMSQRDSGRRQIRRAMRTFEKHEDGPAVSAALNALGLACSADGCARQAIRYHSKALRLAERDNHRRNEALTLRFLGTAYGGSGNQKQAIAVLVRAKQAFIELGDKQGQANVLLKLASMFFDAGQAAEAKQLCGEVAALIAEHASSFENDFVQIRLATLRLQLGDPEIQQFTEWLLKDVRSNDNRVAEGMTLVVQSLVSAKHGRTAEALRACTLAQSKFCETGFEPGEALATRVLRRIENCQPDAAR